jgi:membrane protein implicated in regulation of membrane protease activity
MQYRRWSWWAWALACLVGLVVAAAIILAVWKLPSLLYGDVTQASPDARLQAASSFRTALVAGLAGLAALGSLAIATRTYRLTQQGQITDRFTKAIEQLGSDKMEVRLGGIYALERIANDSPQDRATIAEVLTAFVRGPHHQPTPEELQHFGWLSGWAADVQAALTVLGRRKAPVGAAEPLDLRRANLTRADLRGAQLQGADFFLANLEEAHLHRAQLQGANLEYVNLRYATLIGAQLQDSDLRGARLENADLRGVQLEGAARDSGTVWPDGFNWKAAGVRHD